MRYSLFSRHIAADTGSGIPALSSCAAGDQAQQWLNKLGTAQVEIYKEWLLKIEDKRKHAVNLFSSNLQTR